MSFRYIVREGLSGFRRARLAAAGSVVTITLELLLFGFFYIVSFNTTRLLSNVRGMIEIEAFLQEPITGDSIEAVRKALMGIPGVDHVQFVSKDDAAKRFKEEFGEDIHSVLDFNPLPPSFRIFLKEEFRTSKDAAAAEQRMKQIKGIDEVIYRKEVLEFIEHQTQTIYSIGMVLGVLVALSSVVLVFNTIRLTIAAKRRAIQAMKLVGATRLFVRAPFLIEGIVQGILGAAFAAGILYYAVHVGAAAISPDLADFIHIDQIFFGELLIAGIILGFTGSALSVRRYIGETV